MNVYTYSEARQKLATLLDQAIQQGEVRIKRKDGKIFVIRAQQNENSPLDIEGLDLNLSLSTILESIQESRERTTPADCSATAI